jgi:hypothetical protein
MVGWWYLAVCYPKEVLDESAPISYTKFLTSLAFNVSLLVLFNISV